MIKSLLKAVYSRTLPAIVRDVRAQDMTYLSLKKFSSLVREMKAIKRTGREGDVFEFGIALGGSSIVMCHLMGHRNYHGYDVFGMIPPPGEKDGEDTKRRYKVIVEGNSKGLNGDTYYGYETNLYDKVKKNFADMGVPVDQDRINLYKGLFEDTLTLSPDDKIALAHIDCDWYDPVLFCLETIAPNMVPQGVIVIDDFNDYQGCKDATMAFLDAHPEFVMTRTQPHGVLERRS